MNQRMNPLAIWHGPPSRMTIGWILENTQVDDQGRRYYRRNDRSWARLRSSADFAELNRRLAANTYPHTTAAAIPQPEAQPTASIQPKKESSGAPE